MLINKVVAPLKGLAKSQYRHYYWQAFNDAIHFGAPSIEVRGQADTWSGSSAG